MKIAFLGTPDFALPSLQALYDAGHELCVFTQPDRPKGRHNELVPPPVKVLAQKLGIQVYQFEKIKQPDGAQTLKSCAPELMVTAAFGQILSKENLDVPKYGCINVHGSLLPKYRGAAPIQWAVINGEKVTGVTTMLTDVGLDTGDILLKQEVEIGENETAGELFDRLSFTGAELLLKTINALNDGSLKRVVQDETQATKCRMIKKEDGRIDFNHPAQAIHDLVRGTNPWPGAFACIGNDIVKLWQTRLCENIQSTAEPGDCVIADPKRGLFVQTGDGVLEVTELQFPGAKRMDSHTLLRGRDLNGKHFK